MIWHIFKKDWKLLWPFVAAVAGIWWVASLVLFRIGFSLGVDPVLSQLGIWMPIAAVFCSLFLVVAIAQTEAIPGVRQDWLVRPITRGDLLWEKLLFALLAVGGPIFAANLFEELGRGFALRSAVSGAGWEALFFCVFLVLPLFALASVTHNMSEAFIFGGVCALVFGFLFILSDQVDRSSRGMLMPVPYSGVGWTAVVLRVTVVVVSAAAILWVQYFHRKTQASRILLGTSAALVLCIQLLPWKPAFAIEQHFSRKPVSGTAITIAFDPSQRKFETTFGATLAFDLDRFTGEQEAQVFVPLLVEGIGTDSILISDYADLRISGRGGRAIFHGTGQKLEVDEEGRNFPGRPVYQEIAMPLTSLMREKNQPVQLQIAYSLTLFHLAQSYAIPALNGAERMPVLGSCETRLNNTGTTVALRCLEADMPPACVTAFLENSATGARNPTRPVCRSEYEAYRVPPMPDALGHFVANLPFRDALGLAKYPVDGTQLADSRVVIRVYEPVDHFTRTLAIPNIRLGDWEAQ